MYKSVDLPFGFFASTSGSFRSGLALGVFLTIEPSNKYVSLSVDLPFIGFSVGWDRTA